MFLERTMEEKDKISIVLEEYRSLRTECMQRNTVLNNILTVAGTVTAGSVGVMVQYSAYTAGITTLLIILILVTYTFLLIDYDSRRINFRLRQIEADINRRAGDHLLRWETEHGLNPEGLGSAANRIMTVVQNFFNRPPLSKD